MKLFIKNKEYYLETAVTDANGDFVTGLTVTYEVRNSDDGTLATLPSGYSSSGTMIGEGNIYKIAIQFDTIGQYRVLYFTPSTYENGSEIITVEDYENYKDEMTESELHSALDSYPNKNNWVDEMTASELHNALDSYTNKDDWKADKDEIADQVWDETLSEHLNAGSTGKALDDADATADPYAVADAVWDELVSGHNVSGSFADLIKRIGGLCQENYRIFNPTYVNKSGTPCMTSATIKIYGSASDCENNVNPIAEYAVTATFDSQAKMQTYKVKKV
jgi:hypothetical protein